MFNGFQNMSSKSSFLVGIVGGFLVLCTVGFFILLGIYLKTGFNGSTTADTVVKIPTGTANTNTNNTNTGTTNIKLADIKTTDHIRGGKDAKVTVIEFSDSECPYCKKFHTTMLEIMKAYGDKVRWVYKHAPLVTLHAKAPKEAEAMECAANIGGNTAFWKFTDRLFEITPSNDGLAFSKLAEIAKYAGIDVNKFNTCLNSGKYTNLVQTHLNEAQTAGLQGTPYSVVVGNGQKIPVSGAYSTIQMKTIIDSLLK